jgi:hypothetical protein
LRGGSDDGDEGGNDGGDGDNDDDEGEDAESGSVDGARATAEEAACSTRARDRCRITQARQRLAWPAC